MPPFSIEDYMKHYQLGWQQAHEEHNAKANQEAEDIRRALLKHELASTKLKDTEAELQNRMKALQTREEMRKYLQQPKLGNHPNAVNPQTGQELAGPGLEDQNLIAGTLPADQSLGLPEEVIPQQFESDVNQKTIKALADKRAIEKPNIDFTTFSPELQKLFASGTNLTSVPQEVADMGKDLYNAEENRKTREEIAKQNAWTRSQSDPLRGARLVIVNGKPQWLLRGQDVPSGATVSNLPTFDQASTAQGQLQALSRLGEVRNIVSKHPEYVGTGSRQIMRGRDILHSVADKLGASDSVSAPSEDQVKVFAITKEAIAQDIHNLYGSALTQTEIRQMADTFPDPKSQSGQTFITLLDQWVKKSSNLLKSKGLDPEPILSAYNNKPNANISTSASKSALSPEMDTLLKEYE